ncbi:serine-threonine protein kinase [Streptomyces sp. P9(2023)]|uniref:serine-threonine protein kinase n=1 Tax=Streptomyces sp. P9(2023) TaxID=3064394 RepID=UPI0028F41F28|nr:serine-threonine protein kinase [Streptomyces sp. P9(2023)]MDT9691580.1 serine-threonine protein kinase [Streptomyces sp. P9(2023)]
MAGMSVEPYRKVTFDKDGDGAAGQREALAGLAAQGVTDVVMFAHGWNNTPSVADRLYGAFFAPFPDALGAAGARVGYAGVVWPSMMFSDEPIPDFESVAAVHPGKEAVVGRLAALLEEQPDEEAAFVEFGELLRRLTDTDGAHRAHAFGEGGPDVPDFLLADTVAVCAMFTDALEEASGPGSVPTPREAFGDRLSRYWKGAKEALRQATYYTMKRRAGTVGERGLGPLLGEVARSSPGLRFHLVGHSFGARLVSYGLRGMPSGARNVASVTLLQGAFSHYAFAARLPHEPGRGGALRDLQGRVDGPVVACYSRHDTALRVFYPLASRLARDADSLLGTDRRWTAIGHDGIQAVPNTPVLPLSRALRDGLPASGCVSVDAAEVVGEHSDICHPELARVVVSAGRIGGR